MEITITGYVGLGKRVFGLGFGKGSGVWRLRFPGLEVTGRAGRSWDENS